MSTVEYKTKGVCSKQITFDLTAGVVSQVKFTGGCHGNLQGIGKLVEGLSAETLVAKLKGIDCKGKGTSCPDQLAKAVEEAIAKQK